MEVYVVFFASGSSKVFFKCSRSASEKIAQKLFYSLASTKLNFHKLGFGGIRSKGYEKLVKVSADGRSESFILLRRLQFCERGVY